MLTPTPPPRRGHLLLATSLALFAIFAGLAVCIWYATRSQFEADPKLIAALATAEFIEEPDPSPDVGWPQWRGARRDGVAFDPDLPTKWPAEGLPVLWEKDVSSNEGYSSFAIAQGKVYTLLRDGTDEAIVCWDLADGTERWRKSYASGLKAGESLGGYGVGPRSTPTLRDGLLYTVGAFGKLQCRKAEDGELVWEKDLLKDYNATNLRWGTSFSPLVEGELVFTNPGGPDGKSLVAFDRKTGAEKWRSQGDPAGYSSPMAITVNGERQVLFFTGTSLVGVAASDGALRWRFPWTTEQGVNAATPIPFRAKIDGDEQPFVFISSGYGRGCALVAIVPQTGGYRAVSVFTSNRLCSHFGTPVRVGDHVYGFNETKLVCLNLRTGVVKWEKEGFKKGTLLAVHGNLLILSEDGKLALMKATPESKEILTEMPRVMGRRCWTMPVLAEGRLLLRDEDKVRCLDLRMK